MNQQGVDRDSQLKADIPPPYSYPAPPPFIFDLLSKRGSAGSLICSTGCMFTLLFGLFVIYGSSNFSFIFPGFEFFMVILGVALFAIGTAILTKIIGESRRVIRAVEQRDGVSLSTISSETGVSYERTKDLLTKCIAVGFLKGKIVDDTYIASIEGEKTDSRTVRCPHCDAEFELPEEV
jgi:hypothetical protein